MQRRERGNRERGRELNEREKEFREQVIEVARVARVVAGGKRFRFRATVVIGDGKGRIGMAIGKADDVTNAVAKSVAYAKKHLMIVPIVRGTIPQEVTAMWDRAIVLLKPAKEGTGVIAGGVVRAVMRLAGVSNVVSKMLGTQNKINNLRATIKALSMLRSPKTPGPMHDVPSGESTSQDVH